MKKGLLIIFIVIQVMQGSQQPVPQKTLPRKVSKPQLTLEQKKVVTSDFVYISPDLRQQLPGKAFTRKTSSPDLQRVQRTASAQKLILALDGFLPEAKVEDKK